LAITAAQIKSEPAIRRLSKKSLNSQVGRLDPLQSGDLFLDEAPLCWILHFMPNVTLMPGGQSAEVPPGTLLLDAGEEAGVEMEAGCFNCSCGTCAIAIDSGMENLEPPTDEELNVLDQWNKDPEKYRLTCCVKILKGDVVMRMEH
jgi:ferredoxin